MNKFKKKALLVSSKLIFSPSSGDFGTTDVHEHMFAELCVRWLGGSGVLAGRRAGGDH
jgi:hypothetical protein